MYYVETLQYMADADTKIKVPNIARRLFFICGLGSDLVYLVKAARSITIRRGTTQGISRTG